MSADPEAAAAWAKLSRGARAAICGQAKSLSARVFAELVDAGLLIRKPVEIELVGTFEINTATPLGERVRRLVDSLNVPARRTRTT